MRAADVQKCEGEAHSNAYIDNCMSCAPNWGKYYACPSCGIKLTPRLGRTWAACNNEDCLSFGEKFETKGI